MINHENPKQLTVAQLMDALGQCDRADIVKFFNTDAVSLNNVAFVERYATGNTVYLHSEAPSLNDFSSLAGLDENANTVVEIVRNDENFAETIWKIPSERELLEQDKVLLQELQILIDSASLRANKWRKSNDTQEEYDNYRNWCYKEIWESFWKKANQVTNQIRYYDPDTTYEEDMRAFLEAHTKQIERMETQQ